MCQMISGSSYRDRDEAGTKNAKGKESYEDHEICKAEICALC